MRADALRNRERLVDVARQVFARSGVDASLEEIAREAGVGIGTLYRRFPRREDLIAAVLEEQYGLLADEALRLGEEHSPIEALTLWMRALGAYMTVFRGLAEPVKDAVMDRNTALGRTCARMMDAGDSLLVRAQDLGLVRKDIALKEITALTSGIIWSAQQSAEKHPATPVSAELLMEVVISGLRAE